MRWDLNCDLGEGEPAGRTRALMGVVTSVNVACGGHAGDVASMAACVGLAKRFGLRIGAHPGLWDRAGFGRGAVDLSADAFELLLLLQVGALERVARVEGSRLHHVKLHGSLYHAVERSAGLRRRYLSAMARWWPGLRIYALAGGRVVRDAGEHGVGVWGEVFADRGYGDDGSLLARGVEGGVMTSVLGVEERVRLLCERGVVRTWSGRELRVSGRTLCVHSDTMGSVKLARAVGRALG